MTQYEIVLRDLKVCVDALERIARQATPHPDDTDADRKRDLHHCQQRAQNALRKVGMLSATAAAP